MKNKISKSLLDRIKLANKYIKFAQKYRLEGWAQGGANLLRYTHPITISPKGYNVNVKLEFTQRGTDESTNYTLSDEWDVDELRWVITHSIINPIKKAAKEKGGELTHKGTKMVATDRRGWVGLGRGKQTRFTF